MLVRMLLKRVMALFDEMPGFFIQDCLPDQVFEITTRSRHTYFMLVVDPEVGLVTLSSPDSVDLPDRPVWFHLIGSTFGGSMLKRYWLAEEMYLEFISVIYSRTPLNLSLTIRIREASSEDTERVRAAVNKIYLAA